MYAVDEMDEVEALQGIPRSDVGAPSPMLLADEFSTVVSFVLRSDDCAVVEPLTDVRMRCERTRGLASLLTHEARRPPHARRVEARRQLERLSLDHRA
jgi:hypothetical protein